VKTPPTPGKPRLIITPAQFDLLYQALPDADAQLLVETDIESGMRWGELTEIRVRDLDFATCILTISRAVVELTQDDHPDGGRFLVKDYPKDKEYRRFKLSQQTTAKIQAHVIAKGLSSDDLLFTYQPPSQPRTRRDDRGAAPLPGMTEPNEKGRQYRHGTLTAYNAARCRCKQWRGQPATAARSAVEIHMIAAYYPIWCHCRPRRLYRLRRHVRSEGVSLDRAKPMELSREELLACRGRVAVLVVADIGSRAPARRPFTVPGSNAPAVCASTVHPEG
jgi:integrase